MPSRRHTHRARCAADPCPEYGFWEYGSQREYTAHLNRLRDTPWRCTRHTRAEEVLSAENPERTLTLVATPGTGYTADHLFWQAEGTEVLGSGFEHGPGFKAYAEDFPPGTKVVVTARVVLPHQQA